jgi:hypothetical protein
MLLSAQCNDLIWMFETAEGACMVVDVLVLLWMAATNLRSNFDHWIVVA